MLIAAFSRNNKQKKVEKIRDVEGMKNVEKMASGKKYLACQLGSRVGMLESYARFWIPRSFQNFQEISQVHRD